MPPSCAKVARTVRPPFPSGWASLPILPCDLTLAHTLPVGQSFVWRRRPLPSLSSSSDTAAAVEEFSRAVDGDGDELARVVCLRQTPEALFYTAVYPDGDAGWDADRAKGTTRAWLEDYFQLGRYPALDPLYAEWGKRDPKLFGKMPLAGGAVGVRVLRQDPWECLVSFITSANNNISRITSLMHKLSERFALPVLVLADPDAQDDDESETVYRLFPRAEDIPHDNLESVLRELGFGYRAGYLASSLASLTSRGPVDEELARWRSLPLDEVRNELLALKGVGRKVADCILLMCMDQPHVIPIDTHIYNIATRHPALPASLRKPKFATNMYDPLQQFLSDKWGPLGGWCQAVVFAAEIARRAGVGVEATQTMTVKAEKEVKVAVENVVTTTETTRTKRHKLLEAPASPPTRPKRLRPAK